MSEAILERPIASIKLSGLLGLLTLPLLGMVGFGVGASLLPPNRIGLLGISIATTVLGLVPIFLDLSRPPIRRHLLLSFFSLAYLAHFAMPAFLRYLGTEAYGPDTLAEVRGFGVRDVFWGEVALFVGLLALLIGYALPVGGAASRFIPRMRREWSLESALVVAMLMIPLGWAMTLSAQLGLIPRWAGNGVLGTIASAATFGIALLAICHQRYRSWVALALILLLVPSTMAFNFFTGSKRLILMPLAVVVIAHILITRRLRLRWLLGFLAMMALLFPVSETYRSYMYGNQLKPIQVLTHPRYAVALMSHFVNASDLGTYLRSGLEATGARFDTLGITSVIVRDAGHRVPYQNGRTLAYIPLAYIPRVIWPGKPITTSGMWVTVNFGSGPGLASNTGSGWVGEFYFNFGWPGVAVGMALLGIWLRFLHEFLLGPEATVPALLGGVVALLMLEPVDDFVIAAINNIVFAIAPIVLTHLLIRSVARPPARASSS